MEEQSDALSSPKAAIPSPGLAAPGSSGLEPASVEEAQRQVGLLLESLSSLHDSPRQAAVMDEIYRAAHSLKTEIDETHFAQVVRIARLIQETVRAVRAERVSVTEALGDALLSAVRAAEESLTAVVAGAPDPGTAASVAEHLAVFLASSSARGTLGARAAAPTAFARVSMGRIEAAGHAARDAFVASDGFSLAAGDAAAVLAAFQSMRKSQERSQKELLDALPEALAMVARGAPPTTLAGDLARRISALGTAAAQFEGSLARFAGRVRDAAESGIRTASLCGDALRRIKKVSLSEAFGGFPKLVRRLASRLSVSIDAEVEPGEMEIDVSTANLAETALRQCLRLSLAPSGRSPAKSGRRGGRTFLAKVDAQAEEGRVSIRLLLEGNVPSEKTLEPGLSPLKARLQRRDAILSFESQQGAQATFTLSFPQTAADAEPPRSYVVGKAGEVTYAIPVTSVDRLIDRTSLSAGGKKLSFIKVGDSTAARAGALVREGSGRTVLLFDSLEGEESLNPTSISEDARISGVSSSARRADGSVALVLDVASFLSSRRSRRRSPKTSPRKPRR
jgi:chemotaxis protein histidine kinase CheA